LKTRQSKKSPRPRVEREAAKAARPMTRRQLSRHQRDVMLQRITKIGFGALLAAIILIVAFGYWREAIAPAGEAILRVRGTSITTQTFAKVLGYRQYTIDLQMARLRAFAEQQGRTNPPDDQNSALVQQFVQQQLQQLEQQRAALEGDVLDQMIDDELVRQEAAKRGITLTPAEVDGEIFKQYAPPTPESQATAAAGQGTAAPGESAAQPGATPAAATAGAPEANATPAPTATPMTPDQILATVRKQLDELGLLSEAEYRELIVKPGILRDRLQGLLAGQVPTSAEQVWARHILVDQEEEATDVLAKLQGGADFAALAKEVSQDTSNKDQGGDLGWFAREAMVPEFEEAAFGLQVGQIVTGPVKTNFGYHIIQALGHEDSHPLSEEQLERAKDSALDKWLRAQRVDDPQAIDYSGFGWSAMKWARDWIAKNAKYLQAPPAKR